MNPLELWISDVIDDLGIDEQWSAADRDLVLDLARDVAHGVARPDESVLIEQGLEMGRPSRIQLEIDIADGEVAAARVGGDAVIVAEGSLTV